MKRLLLIIIVSLLLGCAPVIPKAGTTQERIYVAQTTLTGVYRSIADLTSSGVITAKEKASYLAAADKADADLAMAKQFLSKGLPDDAISTLQLTNTLLLELQKKLSEEAP